MNNKIYFENASKIFYQIPFVKTLEIKLVDISKNKAIAEFSVSEKHANYLGGLHGGVIAGVIDTIVFFPYSLLPSGVKLTTAGFDIKFFKPAKIGDIINVVAEIIHFGKRRINVEATAYFKASNLIVAKSSVDLMKII